MPTVHVGCAVRTSKPAAGPGAHGAPYGPRHLTTIKAGAAQRD
ncbi:hypothetical protein [Pseudomonas cavernicola]|nr:hypothetical protein [Pseudomonas cavernicola]